MRTHQLLAILTLPAMLALAACDTPAGSDPAAKETGAQVLSADGLNDDPALVTDGDRTVGDETLRPMLGDGNEGNGNDGEGNDGNGSEPELPTDPTLLELKQAMTLLQYINGMRQARNVQVLAEDGGCAYVAFNYSVAMNYHGYRGGIGPDGQTHTDRMKDAGVGYTMTGALYHIGLDGAEEAFRKLMENSYAVELMLHPAMVDIGVGVSFNEATQAYFYNIVFRHP